MGETATTRSRWGWLSLAICALLVAGLAGQVFAGQQGNVSQTHDKIVAARLQHGPDDEVLPVIIKIRPGARKGLLQKLEAHGAQVHSEFDIIEAVATDLPVGFLRALAHDKDVLGISTDAPCPPRA